MIRRHGTEFRAAMMLADIGLAALLALVVSEAMFVGGHAIFWGTVLPQPDLALALFVSAWVLILWAHGAYRLRAHWSIGSETRVILRAETAASTRVLNSTRPSLTAARTDVLLSA